MGDRCHLAAIGPLLLRTQLDPVVEKGENVVVDAVVLPEIGSLTQFYSVGFFATNDHLKKCAFSTNKCLDKLFMIWCVQCNLCGKLVTLDGVLVSL